MWPARRWGRAQGAMAMIRSWLGRGWPRRCRMAWVAVAMGLAACAEGAGPPAPPVPPDEVPPVDDVAAWCPAGPAHQLPPGIDMRVRAVTVLRLPDTGGNAVRIMACIDAVHPQTFGSFNVGLFGVDGRLAASAGQPTGPRPSGTSFSYAFASEAGREALAPAMLHHRVLLQLPLKSAAGEERTISALVPARFAGLVAGPLGRVAPDACLAAPGTVPVGRDVTGTVRGGVMTVRGCVVGQGLTFGGLNLRAFRKGPPPREFLHQVSGAGSTQDRMAAVRGLWPRRAVVLLAAQDGVTQTPEPRALLETATGVCRAGAGGACVTEHRVTWRDLILAQ